MFEMFMFRRVPKGDCSPAKLFRHAPKGDCSPAKLFRYAPKGVYTCAKQFRHAPTANGMVRNISYQLRVTRDLQFATKCTHLQ